MKKKQKLYLLMYLVIMAISVSRMKEHMVWVWFGEVTYAAIFLFFIEVIIYIPKYIRLVLKKSRRLLLKKKRQDNNKKN